MKKKTKKVNKKYMYIIMALFILIVAVIIGIVAINSKPKKKTKKPEYTNQTYKVDNIENENYIISEIEVETHESESMLHFNIKNNKEIISEAGMMSFKISDSKGNKLIDAETFVSEMAPGEEMSVEIVLNESIEDVKIITVNE